MDVAEVHRRRRDGKRRVVVMLLDAVAVSVERGHELVHAVERVIAEPGIAGVPRLAQVFDRHRQVALVLANRLQARGLADDAIAPEFLAVVGDQFGAFHRGFFVRGGDDRQRPRKPVEIDLAARREREREKALHVAAAEPVDAVVGFARAERIAAPQAWIAGHGVGMARQHQAVAAAAGARDQVGFALVDRLDFDVEAEGFGPVGDQVDDAAVAHVHVGVDAADRWGRDQLRDHVARVGQTFRHRRLS